MQVKVDTIEEEDQAGDREGQSNAATDETNQSILNDVKQTAEEQQWTRDYLNVEPSSTKNNNQFQTQYSSALIISTLALASFIMGNIVSIQAHSYPIKAMQKGSLFNTYMFVFGIFELLIFLATPWFSRLIITKRIKLLINAGLLVTSTCSVLFGLAAVGTDMTTFCILSLIIRIVQAFGEILYIVGTFSFLTKEISHQILHIIIGVGMATIFGLGVFAGEFIGPPIIKVGGYVTPFAVLGCILNLTVFTTSYLLPSPTTGGKWGDSHSNILALIKIPEVVMSTVTLISGACCFGFGFATFREHMEMFQLGYARIGLIYAGNIFVIVIANPIWAYICQKLRKTRIPSVFAAVFIIVAFVLQGPAPFLPLHLTLPICIIAVILQGIGIGGEVVCSCMGSLNEAREHGYPDTKETKNLLFGLGCTGYTIGVFVGSSIGTLMVQSVGYPMASVFITVQQALTAIANIGFACWFGNQKQPVTQSTQNEAEPLMDENE